MAKIEGNRTSVNKAVRGNTTHKLWFNHVQKFAYMQLTGELRHEDLIALFAKLDEVFRGADNHNLLVDMRLSPGTVPDKQLRDLFHEQAARIGLDRVAVLGADSASRMTFKILMTLLHKTDVTRFCKTENQALTWLKKGKK